MHENELKDLISNYKYINLYAERLVVTDNYNALNRTDLKKSILATLNQSRMKSCVLIGPPGTGKTQVVESMAKDQMDNMIVFSIDLSAMGSEGENKFAANITALIEEIITFNHNVDHDVVVFIDEFHVIGKEEYASGFEALKPILGRGRIGFIGATTDEEYVELIEKNEALKERLQRIDVPELDKKTVFSILEDMWKKELPEEEINYSLIAKIIEYGKYIPSEAEPRKSIKLLDQLIGWSRTENVIINEQLLDKRVYATTGVNTKWQVDINKLIENMKRRVLGQEYAIDVLEGSLNVAVAGLNDTKRPMGSYMFIGPTGVGKTEMAKAMSEGLFGTEEALIRFDMSEYQTLETIEKFREKMSDAIKKHPYSIVLLDEIEKANNGIADLLLQILDDGRLTDKYDRQVQFRNAYIILTTNEGHELFEEARIEGKDLKRKKQLINNALQMPGAFRPELIGRIDALIVFEALKPDVRRSIVETRLTEFKQRMNKRGVKFDYSDKVVEYLAFEDVSQETTAGGGRDINRKIKDKLLVVVGKIINEYELDDEKTLKYLKVDVFGKMAIEDKQIRFGAGEGKLGILSYIVETNDGDYERYYGENNIMSSNLYEATSANANMEYITKEENQKRIEEKRKLIKNKKLINS
ncbi:ATP-dependent Clp protease ATP-binding subunit [Mammaliicoccus sciuri]|uniref:AAA family ATPase n=1 Tax=Mammaliicoccus sciuri TaxID=1296 RepID=UPI000E677DC5|nr:AAA family ATPase [Mammaliicoccus sciuri]RIN97125.1 ATP-dependent Clp protease ATP-binding subunit [Mammaliicoccus sciuri]